jgi:hypothetical protein
MNALWFSMHTVAHCHGCIDLRQFPGIFLPVPQRDVAQAKATAKGRPVQHEAYVLTRPEDAVDDNGRVFVAFTTDCLLQRQSELPEHAAADATYKARLPIDLQLHVCFHLVKRGARQLDCGDCSRSKK